MTDSASARGSAATDATKAILRVVIAAAVGIIILVVWAVVPSLIWPAAQVTVPLPVPGVSVRIEVWSWEGQYDLVVRNGFGEIRVAMWKDWGPAQRSSLYLGPDDELFVVGGGGLAMVVLERGAAPRLARPEERTDLDDGRWQYLGAVDNFDDGYRYAPPEEEEECVDFFGEGLRVRAAYEAENSCN